MRFELANVRFDDQRVLAWVDERQARAMNKVGSRGRVIARRSIRKQTKAVLAGRKQPEKGKPPRWRRRGQGTLKDGIFYGFDPTERALFIGPILSSNKRQEGQTVPQWLENNGFEFMGPTLDILDEQNIIINSLAEV